MSALPHMTPILNYSQVHTYIGLPFQANASVSTERLHSCQILTESFYNSHHHARVFDLSNAAEWRPALAEYNYEMTWGHIQHTGPCIYIFSRILLHWCPDARCQWANWWQSKTEQKKGKEKDVFFWKKSFRPDHREKRDGNVKTQRFHSEEYFTLNLSWSKPSPVL